MESVLADSTYIKLVYQTQASLQGNEGKRMAEFGNRGAVTGPAIAKFVFSKIFEGFRPRRHGKSNHGMVFAATRYSWHMRTGNGRIEPFRLEWFDSHRDERLSRFASGRRKRHDRPPWWRISVLVYLGFFWAPRVRVRTARKRVHGARAVARANILMARANISMARARGKYRSEILKLLIS